MHIARCHVFLTIIKKKKSKLTDICPNIFYILCLKQSNDSQISCGNQLSIPQNVVTLCHYFQAKKTASFSCKYPDIYSKHKKRLTYLVSIAGSCVHLIFLVGHGKAGNRVNGV